MTFSFSCTNPSSTHKVWDNKKENAKATQQALLVQSQTNSETSKGEYVVGSQPNNIKSLYVKNRVYQTAGI